MSRRGPYSRPLGHSPESPLYYNFRSRAARARVFQRRSNAESKALHSQYLSHKRLQRIESPERTTFSAIFGVTFTMVDSDYDMGFAMIVQIEPESTAEEQGLIVGDIICLVNGRPIPRDLTTFTINNQETTVQRVLISILRFNPFRLLSVKNQYFIRLLQTTERRHRMTFRRRQLTDIFPYGFIRLDINASDDVYNPLYFTLIYHVETQAALTGRATLYVGDVVATVENIDLSQNRSLYGDFENVIEFLGKPRTLHVNLIPTSPLRFFSVTLDMMRRNPERIRPPLLLNPHPVEDDEDSA